MKRHRDTRAWRLRPPSTAICLKSEATFDISVRTNALSIANDSRSRFPAETLVAAVHSENAQMIGECNA